MDRSLIPAYLDIPSQHWEAMADAIGEAETERLYGPRRELFNTANAVSTLYTDEEPIFAGRAPMRTLVVVGLLAALLLILVVIGGIRGETPKSQIPTNIGDACVLEYGHIQRCLS